ncbi:MAG: hypothetical protein WC313_12255 [Candidatus Kapaibacterium sp.]
MDNNSEILLYHTEDGQTKIDVRMEDESLTNNLHCIGHPKPAFH